MKKYRLKTCRKYFIKRNSTVRLLKQSSKLVWLCMNSKKCLMKNSKRPQIQMLTLHISTRRLKSSTWTHFAEVKWRRHTTRSLLTASWLWTAWRQTGACTWIKAYRTCATMSTRIWNYAMKTLSGSKPPVNPKHQKIWRTTKNQN